jgi:1-acyl-sn-glycerol-3-phosphate acyltransferase
LPTLLGGLRQGRGLMGEASPVLSQRVPPLSQVNHEPGERAVRIFVILVHTVMKPLTRRDWRDQVKVPQTGGVVFVANHISNVDPLVVGQYIAFSGRWPRILAKSSLFGVPVLGWALKVSGQIPVERHSRTASDALSHAIRAVRDGKAVVVYPEGTITDDPDLWPMAGKTGAARIAFATGCPVVPIGQWGAQEIMYGKKIGLPRLLPRKTLRLKTGDPVDLDDLRDEPVTSAKLVRATERMMSAITRLVADLRGEAPPADGAGADPPVRDPEAPA